MQNDNLKLKILGIDFGEKKIGLAISEGDLAEPLGTISQVRQIGQICQDEKIDKIIVGISENEMAEKTRKFGEELAKLTGLPVEYQDETLTSQEATRRMVESGKAKRKRKSFEHSFAAALILQDYLDGVA